MPGGDGTGPFGTGGRCTPLWMSRQISRPLGAPLGFGGGFGRGRGYRWIYRATGLPLWARSGFGTTLTQQQTPIQPPQNLQKDQELLLLENQATMLEQQLKEIRKRIEELKK